MRYDVHLHRPQRGRMGGHVVWNDQAVSQAHAVDSLHNLAAAGFGGGETMKAITFETKARVVSQDGTILAIFGSVEAAWTWIDRHGARGYVVEERTSNGGWKVTHDVP